MLTYGEIPIAWLRSHGRIANRMLVCMHEPKKKELSTKQNLIWNTCGCLIYQACQWLTTIFVVTLSPSYENSGILAFAMATGNIFTALATYNMRTYQVSDVDNEYSPQNYIGFRVATVVGALLVFAVYSVVVSPSMETLVCMLIYLAFKADESFVNVLYGIDQKASRMDYIGISQGIRGILSIGAFATALAITQNLAIALTAMLFACVLVTILYDVPFSGHLQKIRPTLSREIFFQLLCKCAPIVVALVVYGLVATLARQYYGIVYGEEMLGIYAAVATPCVLVQVLANYLYSPFLVPLSKEWRYGDSRSFSSKLGRLFAALIAVSLGCIIGAAFIGPWFLEAIYGDSIREYSWMITPAVIAAALMALSYFLTDLFTLLRQFGFALCINVVALVACAVSIASLTEQLGMNGVNVVLIASFAISVVIGIALLVGIVRKREIA